MSNLPNYEVDHLLYWWHTKSQERLIQHLKSHGQSFLEGEVPWQQLNSIHKQLHILNPRPRCSRCGSSGFVKVMLPDLKTGEPKVHKATCPSCNERRKEESLKRLRRGESS